MRKREARREGVALDVTYLSGTQGSGTEKDDGCAEATALPVEDHNFARHSGVSARRENGFWIEAGFDCEVVGLVGWFAALFSFWS